MRLVIVAAALTATIAHAAQQASMPQQALEQRDFAQALKTLPPAELTEVEQELRKHKVDLDAVISSKQVLSPGQGYQIQRVVEERLKPVPLVKGVLSPVLQQFVFRYYSGVSAAEAALLASRAESIGRLEVTDGSDRKLMGTGFVVSGSTIATNCHVLSEIATEANGTWTLNGDTWLDFGESAAHDSSQEFRISAVAAHPVVRGLDIAVLTVDTKSVDRSRSLPAPLPISKRDLAQTVSAAPLSVGVVGYPSLQTATETLFKQLKARTTNTKFYSPGKVMSAETVAGVDILFHISSTMAGNWGSPVLDQSTMEVIGVHNCCTTGAAPKPSPFACANILENRAFRNGAIAAWSAADDAYLKGFFVRP